MPRASQQFVGRRLRKDAPVADQHELVAAIGLVHHVARDEQRRPGLREPVERVPEIAAQHRVESDGRLVEDEHVGATEQRGRERHARALAAGERADLPSREPDRGRPSRALPRRGPEPLRRSARSSRGSPARSGRRRPRAPASRSRCGVVAPGRRRARPSTSTVPLRIIWTPTIARISVVLPDPLGPSRPVTLPPGTSRLTARSACVEPRTTSSSRTWTAATLRR